MKARRLLTCFVLIAAITGANSYQSIYELAEHYWRLDKIQHGVLEDSSGSAHTVIYNGGRILLTRQLAYVLSLDGRDDYIKAGGFNNDCISNPSSCLNGLTVAFWFRYHHGSFIFTTGAFTNSSYGPGFRFIHKKGRGGFMLQVADGIKTWKLHITAFPNVWYHFAFTWHPFYGLKLYENGNLITYNKYGESVSKSSKYFSPTIVFARPSSVLKLRELGKFDIGHVAIWMSILTPLQVRLAYEETVVQDAESKLCCYFKAVDSCIAEPCKDHQVCRQLDLRYPCICPDLEIPACEKKLKYNCKDKSNECKVQSQQPGYCKQRLMKYECPESCNMCAYDPKQGDSSTVDPEDLNRIFTPIPPTPRRVHPSRSVTLPPDLDIDQISNETMDEFCKMAGCQFYATCIIVNRRIECECPSNCGLEYSPVCGNDGKSYINDCSLRAESCNLQKRIYKTANGGCGLPYPNADHYWPMNNISLARTLADVRGFTKTLVFNGVGVVQADQLGSVVQLDGKDDWIFASGLRGKCVNDPTFCMRGLSVAFWIKFQRDASGSITQDIDQSSEDMTSVDLSDHSEFIMSSGGYTDRQKGPGFRFFYYTARKRYVLDLSTQKRLWRITLHSLPKRWFHFAFTWTSENGLRLYTDGRFIAASTKPKNVNFRPLATGHNSLTIGRPNSLFKLHDYGKFQMGHFVIWTLELTSSRVELAFLAVLTKTSKSLICCYHKSTDACMNDPCSKKKCDRLDQKYACICPQLKPTQSICVTDAITPRESCRDKLDNCAEFAIQPGYCEMHKRDMLDKCARTCSFCGLDLAGGYITPATKALSSASVSTDTLRARNSVLPTQPQQQITTSTQNNKATTREDITKVQSGGFSTKHVEPFTSPRILQTQSTSVVFSTVVPPLLSEDKCQIGNVVRNCSCYKCYNITDNRCCISRASPWELRGAVTFTLRDIDAGDFAKKSTAFTNVFINILKKQCGLDAGKCVSKKKDPLIRTWRSTDTVDDIIPARLRRDVALTTSSPSSNHDRSEQTMNTSYKFGVMFLNVQKVNTTSLQLVLSVVIGDKPSKVLDNGLVAVAVESEKEAFQDLNMTVDSVTAWTAASMSMSAGVSSTRVPLTDQSTVVQATLFVPMVTSKLEDKSTPVPVRGEGDTAVMHGPSDSTGGGKFVHSKTFIIAIAVSISGVVILLCLAKYGVSKLTSKWSGEFIPDPQEQQKDMQEVSYDQLVYSAVDPSGARITDVPAKPKPPPVPIEQTINGPTTKQSQKGSRGTGGKGRGGKAYGPKVTYRPPKWD